MQRFGAICNLFWHQPRHYAAHLRKLDEIRTGKAKNGKVNLSAVDPKLEESIFNVSKHKNDARTFEKRGNRLHLPDRGKDAN